MVRLAYCAPASACSPRWPTPARRASCANAAFHASNPAEVLPQEAATEAVPETASPRNKTPDRIKDLNDNFIKTSPQLMEILAEPYRGTKRILCNVKCEEGAPKDAPLIMPDGSAAVVHLEFHRVGRVLIRLDLFHLQLDIAVDLILGEHVTGQQEVVIRRKGVDRFAQAAADGRDIGQLLGGQIVEVLVHRLARIDLVLDAVQTGHQQRGKAQVGV